MKIPPWLKMRSTDHSAEVTGTQYITDKWEQTFKLVIVNDGLHIGVWGRNVCL